ncbi:MAG: hypothetical protein N3A38_17100 [Planctomycetota bacterium]|nr:hypothetical protein [Planctomycetota bacterium]
MHGARSTRGTSVAGVRDRAQGKDSPAVGAAAGALRGGSMKVKAITDSFETAPVDIIQEGWSRRCDPGITPGKTYEVYALSFVGHPEYNRPRTLAFQIIDDAGFQAWLPAFLFEIVDRKLPSDWEANLFPDGNFVIGPSFVVESPEAYDAMVESDPEAMKKFWERLEKLEAENSEVV